LRVHVKICGISDLSAVLAAVEAGADAVGFVLTESVRRVSPAAAAVMAARVPPRVEKVAVLTHPAPGEFAAISTVFMPDVVQADHDSLGEHRGVALLPVFREAAGVETLIDARFGSGSAARFLYEGSRSGFGEKVDWPRARSIAARGRMTLAGGLTPENVGDAIRAVRPYGVDVSSGVESSPGVKDPDRIRAFLVAVREAEKGMGA
jgi:phosphoribosylanthranilate isomerase